MPDPQQLLSIYLNDHLVGSSAGRDLFRRAAKSHQGTDRGPELTSLAREIDEDRATQLRIMRDLGISPSQPRILAGRIAETIGRLKPNGTVLQRSPLSDVVELEGLRVAVAGKAAGWEVLVQLAETDSRLSKDQLVDLRSRAHHQAERLRALHLRAAAEAFARA